MKKILLTTIVSLFLFQNKLQAQLVVTQSFAFTGSVQSFTVPSCVSTISVSAYGAQGASTTPGAASITAGALGGLGGYAFGVITVTAGQVINVYVGGQNGYNGGGTGGINGNAVSSGATQGNAGNGGGASDLRVGGLALANRIFVAGGGGGGGHFGTWTGCQTAGPAGAGGSGGLLGSAGLTGSSTACNCTNGGGNGGAGGTAIAGGAAGTYNTGGCLQSWGIGSAGVLGNGGNGSSVYHNGTGGGGGGAGGYYGGGCGGSGSDTTPGGGGGGGSSFFGTATGTAATSGARSGDGLVVFNYNYNGAGVVVTPISTVICVGGSVTLTASNVPTYTWSNNSNASSITVNPTSNTSYTVQGTNTLNCISTAIINVTVSPSSPVLTVVTSTNSTCLGKTVTLTASGALTYTWSNSISNGISYTPTATNIYTVQGQNGCGITTATTAITIAPLALTLSSSASTLCAGSAVTLNAVSAATSYSWLPVNQTGNNIIVSPAATTIYTCSVSDGTCSGIANITLSTVPIPTIGIVSSATSICQGMFASLTATGAASYSWNVGSFTTAVISVTPTLPQNYIVVGTNSSGCSSSAQQGIVVYASPPISAFAINPNICNGGTATLVAAGANTYTWVNTVNFTPTIMVGPTVNTTYSVIGAVTNNSCTGMQTVMVNVFDPTVSIVSSATSVCSGGNATLTANGASSYLWSTFSTSSFIVVNPTVTSNYSVSSVTSTNGINCASSANYNLLVNPNPTVTAVSNKTNVCKNESFTLTANAVGASSYSWSGIGTGSSVVQSSSLITTKVYTVICTSAFGCVSSASVSVKILVVNCAGLLSETSISKLKVDVYPNPNHGAFTVQGTENLNLILVNELGQIIRKINLNTNNNFVQKIEALEKGIYFISEDASKNYLNKKVIVIE